MVGPSMFVSHLVAEEIERMVADHVVSGHPISATHGAQEIMRHYQRWGLVEADLADDVIMAAAHEGVVVEIGARRAV